jgi:hypothetical protein
MDVFLNESMKETDTFDMDDYYVRSMSVLGTCRKINLFLTIFLIVFGLVGHSLTVFVFAQKRFRKNSSNVYFLCLALVDAMYLVVHFFKNTIRTYFDIYSPEDSSYEGNSFVHSINLIDRFEFTCRLINYLRNVLRMISAFIIVTFTIQRLILVRMPFLNKFKFTFIINFKINIYILNLTKKGLKSLRGEQSL